MKQRMRGNTLRQEQPKNSGQAQAAVSSPMAQMLHDSARMSVQRQVAESIKDNPRMAQQQQRMAALKHARAPEIQRKKAGHSYTYYGKSVQMPAQAVVQRLPVDALGTTEITQDDDDVLRELKQTLANVRRISQTYSNVGGNSESLLSLRASMRTAIETYIPMGNRKSFVAKWNDGLSSKAPEFYSASGLSVDYKQKSSKPALNPGEEHSFLSEWQERSNNAKTMTPDRKMAAMLPMILARPDLPENLKIALKLFFTHTANFVPEEHQGRDFRSHEHGQYYRSSNTPSRRDNSEFLERDALQIYDEQGLEHPRRRTFQVINQYLHQALIEGGKMNRNIEEMIFYVDDVDPSISYAEYTSSVGSGTGSLGLIQNIYRTLQVGGKVELDKNGQAFGGLDSTHWQPQQVKTDLSAQVPESKLGSSTNSNYHDFLLADRSSLVRETSAAIEQMYQNTSTRQLKVVPIQSDTHASLILEVVYPNGRENQISEAQWRELFIGRFNASAAKSKNETRLTHRGSFGFLQPTASSVGGPVRIWPGLLPRAVFKQLILQTLQSLSDVKEVNAVGKTPRKTLTTRFPSVRIPGEEHEDGMQEEIGKPAVLHIEALKSAVRYAQDTMRDTLVILGPQELVQWVAVRLQRNLLKASRLLDLHDSERALGEEAEYIKASSVIENLMEYAYLLDALRVKTGIEHDPYPQHLRQELALDQPEHGQQSHTFYLDSGMQAIVCAHLLARAWLENSGKVEKGESLRTLDLNTYFEYASIDKSNLLLAPMNRSKQGGYRMPPDFSDIPNSNQLPHIVSADLNPVLTSKASKKTQASPSEVLTQTAGNPGHKNDLTVPVIDITNATLGMAAKLQLGRGYENFVIVESLSKHQQLGADKYTMGRLNAVGGAAFIQLAHELIDPIEARAYHPLVASYRVRMDRVFYGVKDDVQSASAFLAYAGKFDAFMEFQGYGQVWKTERKQALEQISQQQDQQERHGQHDDAVANLKQLLQKVLEDFESSLRETRDLTQRIYMYGISYRQLPTEEQSRLRRYFSDTRQDGISEELPWLQLENEQGNGISNVGNTCYLAAALNSIAFSPHRNLFNPLDDDPKAQLRDQVKQVLDKIVQSQPVGFEQMTMLLSALDHANLLEGPNAFVVARPLNAQRDPAEVMNYLLGFFGITDAGSAYLLEQTTRRTIDLQYAWHDQNANPNDFSQVGEDGVLPEQSQSDWLIKLPIADRHTLEEALHAYQATENIQLGANFNGRVAKGWGTNQIRFGAQAPMVISIQLLRWELTQRGIVKNTDNFDMPAAFVLNGYEYHLQTIIHHHGDDPHGGHYTSNVRNGDQWERRDDSRVGLEPDMPGRIRQGYLYTYARGAADEQIGLGFRYLRPEQEAQIENPVRENYPFGNVTYDGEFANEDEEDANAEWRKFLALKRNAERNARGDYFSHFNDLDRDLKRLEKSKNRRNENPEDRD